MKDLLRQLSQYQLVLASKSPRRQQLLQGMEIPFKVITKDTDEYFPESMPVHEIATYLSQKKSAAFALPELPENFLLITADTIVVKDQLVLNKPANSDEAMAMLSVLSDSSHLVITGITLRSATKSQSFDEVSEVKFGKLETDEMVWYIDQHQPFDKAGAYGIQEWIGYIGIESVKGSFYNVMGLPTHKLFRALKNF